MADALKPPRANRVPKHLDVEEIKQHLERSIARSVYPKKECPYGAVVVRFLRFYHGDLPNLEPLEKEMARVFQDDLGYEVRFHEIGRTPSTSHDRTVIRILNDDMDYLLHTGKLPLLIVVFSGHGHCVTEFGGKEVLKLSGFERAAGSSTNPFLNWQLIANFLACAEIDVLQILDCCSAGLAAQEMGPELLASTSATEMASPDSNKSFINALTTELRISATLPRIRTAAQLFRAICINYKIHKLDYLPIHWAHHSKPSIPLAKLGQTSSPVPSTIQAVTHASDPRVVVSVHINENVGIDDLEKLGKWLTMSVPDSVNGITIDAVYPASSTVLLLAVPIHVWTMLPDDGTFGFVTFTDAPNLLSVKSAVQVELPARTRWMENVRPGGNENIRPGSNENIRPGGNENVRPGSSTSRQTKR